MAKKETTKKGISVIKVAAIGAGVAVVGAGAYALLGPNGKKNQKKAKDWMIKMEKDAENLVKKVKDIDATKYYDTVDSLASKYLKKYKDNAPEIKALAKQLKTEWSKTKKIKPAVKKVVKKALKKS